MKTNTLKSIFIGVSFIVSVTLISAQETYTQNGTTYYSGESYIPFGFKRLMYNFKTLFLDGTKIGEAYKATGKIIQILPLQKGNSPKGEWQKQDFIIETQEQYPKKICITFWNPKFDIAALENKQVKVFFDIESREYNGRWYTDVKAWKVDVIAAEIQSIDNNLKPDSDSTKDFKDLPWDEGGDATGDLPF